MKFIFSYSREGADPAVLPSHQNDSSVQTSIGEVSEKPCLCVPLPGSCLENRGGFSLEILPQILASDSVDSKLHRIPRVCNHCRIT